MPLKILVETSKLDIAVVLNNLFENMSKVTKTTITIVDLKKVTDICNIPMAIKNHQDVNDLLNSILNNLVEDPLCGSSIRSLFQCCSISIKRCVVCSNIQFEKTFEFSLTLPVLHSVSRKSNVSLSNLIYSHHFLNENEDNILGKKCNNRVLLIFTLDRCSFDKDKLENVIDDSPNR